MALNLNDLRTPGVYIDEVNLLPPSVAGVQTGIPAFVGYTQMAKRKGEDLTLVPTRITSMREYEQYFGKAQTEGKSLSIVITDVFITRPKPNDAGREEIQIDQFFKAVVTADLAAETPTPTGTGPNPAPNTASTPSPKPSAHNMYYSIQMYFQNGGGPCYIVSVGEYTTPGAESIATAKLVLGLEALKNEDEPTLLVFPEAVNISSNYTEIYDAALKQALKLQDRFVIMDVKIEGNDPIATFRNASLDLEGLKYGAAYYPYLETTIDYNYGSSETSEVQIKYRKIVDGVSQAVKDGYTLPSPGTGSANNLAALKKISSNLYEKARNELSNLPIRLPSSPAMAGIYAKVDAERGVWKAPANVSLAGVTGPSIAISDEDQKTINVDDKAGKSINAIRTKTGYGTLVWGARTLAGNDNEWRYIPVRRFFNFVEESVKNATFRFVFEPNDANTWVRAKGMIENFLTLQWRQGALQGAKPEDAFFVNVGLGKTMTPIDILEGRMIIEIGMAVVRPAEFIILRFMHKMAES